MEVLCLLTGHRKSDVMLGSGWWKLDLRRASRLKYVVGFSNLPVDERMSKGSPEEAHRTADWIGEVRSIRQYDEIDRQNTNDLRGSGSYTASELERYGLLHYEGKFVIEFKRLASIHDRLEPVHPGRNPVFYMDSREFFRRSRLDLEKNLYWEDVPIQRRVLPESTEAERQSAGAAVQVSIEDRTQTSVGNMSSANPTVAESMDRCRKEIASLMGVELEMLELSLTVRPQKADR